MTVTRVLARPLLAGMFVYGGIDALRHPEGKVLVAEDVAAPIAEALGLPTDPVTLIRINGGVQVAGGLLLAVGKVPRVASFVLAASLVPTTYAGHRFWNEPDEAERARQRVQFLKNLSMLGGLMLAAVDTEGRPSVAWRARRMVRNALPAADAGHLAEAPLDAVASLAHDAADFGREAGQALASETVRLSQKAGASSRRARKSALAASKQTRTTGIQAGRATQRIAKQAIRQAALAAVVGAATSGHRAESMASRARETAEHARGGARKALQDVTVDSARAAVGKVIDDARSVLPLTG
jgi:uncharacterized membrane protein YphA (DoxX/SURF4 family)